jgi:hypothetical protein
MCDPVSIVPYIILFTGVGFVSAVVIIVLLSRAEPILDKLLTNGFFAQQAPASQPAKPAGPASQLRIVELGAPQREDPKLRPRQRRHTQRPFLNRKA